MRSGLSLLAPLRSVFVHSPSRLVVISNRVGAQLVVRGTREDHPNGTCSGPEIHREREWRPDFDGMER
jgi:hypothetical protein